MCYGSYFAKKCLAPIYPSHIDEYKPEGIVPCGSYNTMKYYTIFYYFRYYKRGWS